jgi:hypothetical protein
MIYMKFHIILIITACLLFLLLSCCSNDKNKLLTFYYHSDDFNKKGILTELNSEFERSQHIAINETGYYKDELDDIIKNGKFDLIEMNYQKALSYIKDKYILSLDSIKNHMCISGDIFLLNDFEEVPVIKEFGITWLTEPVLLFVNNDICDLFGENKIEIKNMESLISLVKKHDTVNGIRGFGLVIKDNKDVVDFFLPFILSDSKVKTLLFDSVDSEIIKRAFLFYSEISKFSGFGTKTDIKKFFCKGELAMIISGMRLKKYIEDYYPKLNYEILLLPSDRGGVNFSVLRSTFLFINKNSRNKNELFSYLKYLTSDSMRIKMHKRIFGIDDIKDNIMFCNYGLKNEKSLIIYPENKRYCFYSDRQMKVLSNSIEEFILSNMDTSDIEDNLINRIENISKKHISYR